MRTALATTLHDPDALLAGPFEEAAPKLAEMFGGVAVSLTEATHPRMSEYWPTSSVPASRATPPARR